MADRLDDVLTPVSREDFFRALWRAWVNMFETLPSRDSVLLLVAHWALETGWGKSMHCFNIGNVKSKDGDGRDFCYFACGEEIPLSLAEKWVREAPSLVTIKRIYVKNGVKQASVWVEPDHFAARFRAYRTLEEGVADYLALLRRRFTLAWPFVCVGDPVGFVQTLKQQNYFTADSSVYAASVRSIFSALQKNLQVDTESLPVISDDQARRLMDLVALTSQELTDALVQEAHENRRKDED